MKWWHLPRMNDLEFQVDQEDQGVQVHWHLKIKTKDDYWSGSWIPSKACVSLAISKAGADNCLRWLLLSLKEGQYDLFHSLLKVSYQKSGHNYSTIAKVTYVDWAGILQLQGVREMLVLEVQAVQEDLDVHHSQLLVVQVAPEVQEDLLLNLPLDPSMKGKGTFDCFRYLPFMCILS